MGRVIFFLTLALLSAPSDGGPVATQFSSGYGGIAFGTTLDHSLEFCPGASTISQLPPDSGSISLQTTVRSSGNVVEYIGITVPYERREQLLGGYYYRYSVPMPERPSIRDWPRFTPGRLTMESRSR
jgi:hypothetical protein